MAGKMGILDWLAMLFLIIGGLNWGIMGFLQVNLVEMVLGSFPMLVRIIYSLVGLSAIYSIFTLFKMMK